MKCRLGLGGEFTVEIEGVQQRPPPNRSVATLLLLLVNESGAWCSRQAVGEMLYPLLAPAKRAGAVRQAIFRLRAWLPTIGLQTEGRQLRLSDTWEMSIEMGGGRTATGLQIAPDLSHPYVDALRMRLASPTEDASEGPERKLFDTVRSIALTDVEVARQILCSAPQFACLLPQSDLTWLLGLTRPQTRGATMACEHEELTAGLHVWMGQLRRARNSYLKAFRIASQIRDPAAIARTSSLVMFTLIELGEMEEAGQWLATLMASDRADSMRLLVLNAKAAFFWNNNQLDEALATMRSARSSVKRATRTEQAHYFSNLAVLEAESGLIDTATQTIAQGEALIQGPQDRGFKFNLLLARAEVESCLQHGERAAALLEAAIASAEAAGLEVMRWYLLESRAEVAYREGQMQFAHSLWRSVEADRMNECVRLTPRVLARKHRIFSGS